MPSSLERPQLRKLLEDTLRTDADLDAFLLDYFPETKKQCTDGMTRIQKLNLLLEKEDASEILNALHSKRPQLAGGSRAGVTAQQDASPRIIEEPTFTPKPNSAQLESPDSLPPPRYFLHLSDLHFSDENQADQWHAQLLLDMRKQMKIRELSGVIVSGDITNHATVEQFGFAQDFFRQLCTSFRVARERLILVPGNHDVNWKLTDASQDGFSPFAAFYRSVTGSDYPSSPAQQTTLHHFPDLKLLVLGCNSACQIDRANPGRAGLHKRAFGKAISSLVTNEEHERSTKLAVWHHPPSELTQGTELLDGAVLEQLAQAGFQLILHGHVHRADNAEFRYYRQVSGGGMEILTAGTFGAPTHELVSGYPFQYQVLEFRGDHLTVHTRKRENVAGGWIADHRWSQAPGQSPASFYQIRLRGSKTGPHSHLSPRPNLTMILVGIGVLISVLLVAVLVAVLTRSPAPMIIIVTQEELTGKLQQHGADPKKLDSPEEFADKVQRVPAEQLRYEVSTGKDQETNELLRWVLALLKKDDRIVAATKYGVKQQRAWTVRVTPQARLLAKLTEGIDRKLEQHTLFDLRFPTLADMRITSQDMAGERLDLAVVDMGIVPLAGMVEIPAGSFLMGSNDGDADEKPVHRVTLPGFYLDRTEVTMAQYQACVTKGGCSELQKTVKWVQGDAEWVKKWSPFCNVNQAGREQHPVNCVDWSQAATYCKWAGKRLPTEEEWEYAARGTDGRKYPWGNEAPRAGLLNGCGSECIEMGRRLKLGWNEDRMYSGNDGWETTAPVGSVKGDKSPFGVMDMGGNVTEWLQDWYRNSYQKSDGPTKNRSLRGASWSLDVPSFARAPGRVRNSPGSRFSGVGFRCARTK